MDRLEELAHEAQTLLEPYEAAADAPTLVYHYTTLPGAYGILTSHSVWCSNVQHSNDPAEATFAHDMIEAELTKRLKGTALAWVHAALKTFQYYAASFSANRDLLPQWRAYCNRGRGMAIGIRSDVLRQHKRMMFGRVEYDNRRQKQVVQSLLDIFAPAIAGVASDADELRKYTVELASSLVLVNGLFKSGAYASEEEYRSHYASTPTDDVLDTQLKFRASPMSLIPYFVVDLQESEATEQTKPFGAVVIGPCLDSLVVTPAVRLLLDHLNYQSVELVVSDVKMRAE